MRVERAASASGPTWKEHLLTLDPLPGRGAQGLCATRPLNEYKREAFDLFEDMLNGLREQVTQVPAVELQMYEPEDIFGRSEQKW